MGRYTVTKTTVDSSKDMLAGSATSAFTERLVHSHSTGFNELEREQRRSSSASSLSHLSLQLINCLIYRVANVQAASLPQDLEYQEDVGGTNQALLLLQKTSLPHDARSALAFLEQTLYFVLRDREALLKSFIDARIGQENGGRPPFVSLVRPEHINHAFRLVLPHRAIIVQSLSVGLQFLNAPPPALIGSGFRRPKKSHSFSLSALSDLGKSGFADDLIDFPYITDPEACRILLISLHCLMADVPWASWSREIAKAVRTLRLSTGSLQTAEPENSADASSLQLGKLRWYVDVFEEKRSLWLASEMCKAIAVRLHYQRLSEAEAAVTGSREVPGEVGEGLVKLVRNYYIHTEQQSAARQRKTDCGHGASGRLGQPTQREECRRWALPTAIIERLHNLLLEEWDGNEEVEQLSAVAGALFVLSQLCKESTSILIIAISLISGKDIERDLLGLEPELFHMSFLSDRFDPLTMPVEWHNAAPNPKTLHLLSFPFLFPPTTLVTFFRAINFQTMSRAFEAAVFTCRQLKSHHLPDPRDAPEGSVLRRLATAMSVYLVLDIHRDRALSDALDQLWRREKRELMRPLKVRLGTEEGEEGVDHGGVQQEFFAIALQEALRPEYGT